MKKFWKLNKEKFFLCFLLLLSSFFSLYKLADSPPIWFDEGFIIQSAESLIDTGKMGIQFAPGEFARKSNFFSTGYTVAYPVGIAMKFFGKELFFARMIIVFYLALFVLFFYLLAKEIWDFRTAVLASILIVSFAPLYGNGRNVLGEVPGLFFLVLFLFYLCKLEKSDFKSFFYLAVSGLAFGFCVFTKPLFLVLIPAVFLSFIFFKKNIALKLKQIFLFFLFFSFPAALWFMTQTSRADSILKILSTYANPYAVSHIYPLVIKNMTRFFTEKFPIYFLILFTVWFVSIAIRIKIKKKEIITVESISFIFAVLVWLAYFRTEGWYRYLFTANVLALLYIPSALYVVSDFLKIFLFKNSKLKYPLFFKTVPLFFLSILIFFQFYNLVFDSWVATHYKSERTKDLREYFRKRGNSKSIFIYRNAEIAPFLHGRNYYQYLKITDALIIGEGELYKINLAVPDEIVLTADALEELDNKTNNKLLLNYKEKDKVNKYLILERKK